MRSADGGWWFVVLSSRLVMIVAGIRGMGKLCGRIGYRPRGAGRAEGRGRQGVNIGR